MSKRPRGQLPKPFDPSNPRQAGIAADIRARYLQHFREDTLPRGPRGIFYDLRPNGMGNGVTYRKPDRDHPITPDPARGLEGFGPMEAYPKAVQEVLTLMRRSPGGDWRIPEEWVADTRAPLPLMVPFWSGPDSYADDVVEDWALDLQAGQNVYVEVLCEAEDLGPRLQRVAKEYGVHVYSGAGFDGIKGKRAFAERAIRRSVPTVVLQVGDLDTHGGYISDNAAEDAEAWARDLGDDGCLHFRRIAITEEQARQVGALDADGKAEADALPVPVMDAILRAWLNRLLPPTSRERVLAERDRLLHELPAAIQRAIERLLEGDGARP